MGLRARGKGVEVINVVFSNPQVAKYDIVASAESEGALSCTNFEEHRYNKDLLDGTNLDAELTSHSMSTKRLWGHVLGRHHRKWPLWLFLFA